MTQTLTFTSDLKVRAWDGRTVKLSSLDPRGFYIDQDAKLYIELEEPGLPRDDEYVPDELADAFELRLEVRDFYELKEADNLRLSSKLEDFYDGGMGFELFEVSIRGNLINEGHDPAALLDAALADEYTPEFIVDQDGTEHPFVRWSTGNFRLYGIGADILLGADNGILNAGERSSIAYGIDWAKTLERSGHLYHAGGGVLAAS